MVELEVIKSMTTDEIKQEMDFLKQERRVLQREIDGIDSNYIGFKEELRRREIDEKEKNRPFSSIR